MSHKKYGPDRFSRFNVYWIQTDRQTPRHPDKPNLYIDYEQRSGNFRFTEKIVPEIVPEYRNFFHIGNAKNFRIISVRKL